jgi:ABC-type multidrug transport system ATPase subunit
VSLLLETVSLRVDVAGAAAIDGLTLASTGEWVLVLGGARALFEAAAGLRGAERGSVRIEGQAPVDAIRHGVSACAPLDPPLPPRWTPRMYARWSASLAGHAKAVARSMAAEALARLELKSFADARLSGASPAVRRATVIAAALATGATTLLVEDPIADLAPEVGRPLARTFARALAGRRVAFFAAHVALESPVALAADEAIVVDGSLVAHQGAPAQLAASERALTLRVAGDAVAFTTAVCAAGATLLGPLQASTQASAQPLEVTERTTNLTESADLREAREARTNLTHVRLDAGPLATSDVLRIALECRAVVLEVHPIARAFA